MKRPAVFMVLGSCASLQVGATFAARLFPVTGSAGATLLRLSLAALVLALIARPTVRAWRRVQWRSAILLGLTLGAMNGFFYASIARIPLGPAVTIEFLGPLTLAAVLSRRARDVAWVLLAALGVAILGFSHGAAGLDPLGIVYVLLAACFWALYILASRRAGQEIPGQGGLAIALLVGALAVLPFGLAGAGHAIGSSHLMLVALGTAVLASVIPYTLELSALRRLPTHVFGILLSLEPAVAALAGWLLLGQSLTWGSAAVIVVVVLASVGSTVTARTVDHNPVAAPDPEWDAVARAR